MDPGVPPEGDAVADTLRPDRLVFGVLSAEAEKMLREVYRPMLDAGTPVVVTDLTTAELTKVAANSFLATKISFINAMSELCEATGADVVALADASATTPASVAARWTRVSVSAAAACPRTSAPSWPAPRSSVWTRRCRSCVRWTPSTPSPQSDGRAGRRGV